MLRFCDPTMCQPVRSFAGGPYKKVFFTYSTSELLHGNIAVVLVTGGSGFLASHVIVKLLQAGYRVRATVRSLANANKVEPVRALDPTGKNLELVEADLMDADCWPNVVRGCEYVQHVASPFPIVADETVIPTAINGTLNVLEAAAQSTSVRKVVLTSSCITLFDGRPYDHAFNEHDWSNIDHNIVRILPYDGGFQTGDYGKSKTLAERTAWNFVNHIDEGQNKFKMTTILPSLICGPPLVDDGGSSIKYVKGVLTGETSPLPIFSMPSVDVGDVATAHLRAMTNPESDGHRFICSAQPSLFFRDIARILEGEFGPQGYTVSKEEAVPTGDPTEQEIVLDNTKIQKILGIRFRNPAESLIDMSYAIIERGVVPKANGYKGCAPKADSSVSARLITS